MLIDNGNPPEVTAELACRVETDPRLTLVSGHGNVGFARGCNLGARRAKGRYLLLLNPDCRLGPGAVPALLAEATALGEDWMLGLPGTRSWRERSARLPEGTAYTVHRSG